MDENETSNSDKLKHSLCYVPIVWAVFFFTENKKSSDLMKHIKYWTFIFIVYIMINFLIVWLFMLKIWAILFLLYAWIAGFLWWKAYNWEDVQLDYIDDFEQKIKDNLNDDSSENPTSNKTTVKKKDKKDDDTDADVLDF